MKEPSIELAASNASMEIDVATAQFSRLRQRYGFVPALFDAQARLPRLIDAQLDIADAVLLTDGALSQELKELIGVAIAAECRSAYGAALHWDAWCRASAPGRTNGNGAPRLPDLSAADNAALQFSLTIARNAPSVTLAHFGPLRDAGFGDRHVLEIAGTAALSLFECTVATGLAVAPDFDPPDASLLRPLLAAGTLPALALAGPHRPLPEVATADAERLAPGPSLTRAFGFVPRLFRLLMTKPDLASACASGMRLVLFAGDALSRAQKELIFLVVSAANLNTYCVAAHCEMLRALGVPVEHSDQVAVDHRQADLPERDKVLLDVVRTLKRQPLLFGPADLERLRQHGFTEAQVLEAVVTCGLAEFVNALSAALVAEPDFDLPPMFSAAALPPTVLSRTSREVREQAHAAPLADPDWPIVLRVRTGDIDAFEDLVRRHGRRVQGAVGGILRHDGDIEDAVQETFIRAFQHIDSFHGRSSFRTWLTRIAINTGLQLLRSRRPVESLDESLDGEDFHPRNVQAWQEDPETAYSRASTHAIVLKAVMQLPRKYRVVVMLRDLQQLSTAETAAALDLGVPGVKARLFRGRLMLRDALAPYFARESGPERGAAPDQ